DFGRDIIPGLVAAGKKVYIYDFAENNIPGEPADARPYWRDVGTVESFFQANMEVRSRLPAINLYNREWRIRTAQRDYPPARIVRHGEDAPAEILDSLICEGSVVASAKLHRVMLGYDCFVHTGSHIENSVLASGCNVGAGAHLANCLLDKNCSVEPGARVGFDPEADRKRFPFITETGIVVLPKGTHVPAHGPIMLAHDMEFLLRNDPATRDAMAAVKESVGYRVSERNRHSHESAGPRYRRFSAPHLVVAEDLSDDDDDDDLDALDDPDDLEDAT
ncbi:MAG: hypothetical protein KC636_34150, partial [Myxococcales bacterium]|nr:hypothetical protein [Myxococcales bacterium]